MSTTVRRNRAAVQNGIQAEYPLSEMLGARGISDSMIFPLQILEYLRVDEIPWQRLKCNHEIPFVSYVPHLLNLKIISHIFSVLMFDYDLSHEDGCGIFHL